MPSLNGIFEIARTGLNASQEALNVTSHNISNVNTPGYTRQRATLEAKDPVSFGGHFFGTGVDVKGVERVYDRFVALQLNDARSGLSADSSRAGILKDLEGVLNDLGGAGISKPLDDFFNSFEELSSDPSSRPARQAVLSGGIVLSDAFKNVDSRIRREITNVNGEIAGIVKDINDLSAQVAALNKEIQGTDINGASSNDLKDKRDVLLGELAGKIGITTIESSPGVVDVVTDGGFSLVAGVTSTKLTVSVNGDNNLLTEVTYKGANLAKSMKSGALKGVIDGRNDLTEALDNVNLLSATIIKEVNVQHRAGYGLDSGTGVDFFTPMNIDTAKMSANSGGALISGGTVTDPSALTLDDYEVRFSDPANYIVVNLGTNSVVTSGAYTSGAAINFDGISVTVTDSPTAPAAGDVFSISATKSAAMNMGVSITSTSAIAASSTAAGLPGDNTNALALSGLRDKPLVSGATLDAFYQGIVSDTGTKANDAENNAGVKEAVLAQIEIQRTSVSGVSIDEEAINMIKLQKAFEASARLLSTANEMFNTLLNIR
ncbi:MAG: flagellar hook-associated protein FlgK [Thermodesulfobacteriota bacterium]